MEKAGEVAVRNVAVELLSPPEEQSIGRAAERMTADMIKISDVLDPPEGGGQAPSNSPGTTSDFVSELLSSDDGSSPMSPPEFEAFLISYLDNRTAYLAWKQHISSRCTDKSAGEQASRYLGRADVKRRLRFLIRRQKAAGGEPDPEDHRAAPQTKADAIKELERLYKKTVDTKGKQSLMDQIIKLRGWVKGTDEQKDPDPAWLMAFLKRAAAESRNPVDLARESAGETVEQDSEPGADSGPSDEPSAQDVVVQPGSADE